MPLYTSQVLGNREIATDYYQLDFSWPTELPAPVPGQFFTIRVAPGPVPLLRRPFGFSGITGDGEASTIYWRRGNATRAIAGMQEGDAIDVLAPLGRGFPSPAPDRRPVLIAGGVGVGPILFLANLLAGLTPEPILILGARTAASLPEIALEPGVKLLTATDDGTRGFHGNAIALAQTELTGSDELFLCGPHPMLEAGHSLAVHSDIPAWVAMEQMMGCAVGACMGCAIPVHGADQYARVCTEGPVFRSTEIDWERVE